jgi:hypothetical protein
MATFTIRTATHEYEVDPAEVQYAAKTLRRIFDGDSDMAIDSDYLRGYKGGYMKGIEFALSIIQPAISSRDLTAEEMHGRTD